eukprot:TRINITY_DN4201_c0_g2_i2.p2 TRINITY_DN4201_c0_g2~~TRINITY_DN4201_c0_g2_i2.p2  ORF type:complete len:131 (+),score=17.63 TRINITY_DN4201_c0_g2_i2:215-607(+)
MIELYSSNFCALCPCFFNSHIDFFHVTCHVHLSNVNFLSLAIFFYIPYHHFSVAIGDRSMLYFCSIKSGFYNCPSYFFINIVIFSRNRTKIFHTPLSICYFFLFIFCVSLFIFCRSLSIFHKSVWPCTLR